MKKPHWKTGEIRILREWYPRCGPTGVPLEGRSPAAIRTAAHRIGLKIRQLRKWSDEELKILREQYPEKGSRTPVPHHPAVIRAKARALGIRCRKFGGGMKAGS
ncbi:MAG TPA: hypothetical protein DIC36_03350 [Gammaproteobacteria bacterium]|nr:hypothetical protein [Gammaproteobacteria bacterium]